MVLFYFGTTKMVNTFFVRISSDCNLNCEYCYVFNHIDKTSRYLPNLMSFDTINLLIERLKDYQYKYNLDELLIVFHGGEPLLMGPKRFTEVLKLISSGLSDIVKLGFSVQTNGSLLTKQYTTLFKKFDVGVSVSIDGPQKYHDIYRVDKKGIGSWERVIKGIKEIQKYPELFSGTISVINPQVPPRKLFEFLQENNILVTDFLLPDGNYDRIPKHKDSEVNIYIDWLVEAFDVWFAEYQNITVRVFENVLESVSGLDVSSDVFGGGELSYLTIETDGSYHTSDILKTTYEGASKTNLHLSSSSIEDVINSSSFIEYNFLLEEKNLPEQCQTCEEMKYCKGGCLPHRYSLNNGFDNPSIYCDEMKSLIQHARIRLIEVLGQNQHN